MVKHTTYKNADDWGMVYDCFTHITKYNSFIYIKTKSLRNQSLGNLKGLQNMIFPFPIHINYLYMGVS